MPSREDVRRAKAAIKRVSDWNYFFQRLTLPGWIGPLEEEGLFAEPASAVSDGKTVSFPFWAPAEYLARMASQAPEQVLEVILRIPSTDNTRIHQSYADAALAMPAAIAARIVPAAAEWLKVSYHMLVPDKLGRLVARLASGGQTVAAAELTKALLTLRPDPRYADSPGALWLGRPQPSFEDFFYKGILKRDIPGLISADPGLALQALADVLEASITASIRPRAEQPRDDHSYAWQAAVEDHPQNHDLDLRSSLVAVVRDAALAAVRAGAIELPELVRRFNERPWKVFTRIALYAAQEERSRDPEVAKRLVLDSALASDIGVDHEYWNLAADVFVDLRLAEQEEFLASLRQHTQTMEQDAALGDDPARRRRLARHEWFRQLTRLSEHLPESGRADLAELEAEFEPLEHPDLLSHMTSWVGPTSPKSAADLASMPVEEQIEFLRSWQPSGKGMDDSPEGLGRALMAAIGEAPVAYGEHAGSFRGLDPTYVRALIGGLREARKARRPFPWVEVLGLADWVLAQPRAIPGREPDAEERDKDPDWGWTRKEIAGLLEEAFQEGPGVLPRDLAPRAWVILAALAEDPDPTPAHETQYGGENMDPLTLSLNSVRTQALHAVIQYALWRFREYEARGDTEALKRGFANMPEVRELLEKHMQPSHDPSLAVRAVFGRWLPWLLLIDPVWTRAHLAQILPRDEALRPLRNAAWSSYLLYSGGVYNNLLTLLADEYAFAIERLGKEHYGGGNDKEVDPHFADHLMVFYLRGLLNLEDPEGLIQRFYRFAPAALRQRAFGFIGRSLINDKSPALPNDIRKRMENLLDVRIASETPWPEKAEELAEFGWWFGSGKFAAAWALPRLLTILRNGRQIDGEHHVVQQLEVVSTSDPVGAVEALRWVVEVDERGWDFSLWTEEGRRVLERALACGDLAARDSATRAINLLAARGNRTYMDLLLE